MSENNENKELHDSETEVSESADFPINQVLLDEATHAKEEWKVMSDRLKRIEEHKNQVTQAVYEKVRRDYMERIKQVTEAVMAKKAEVDIELSALIETRDRISEDLKIHQHNLEEIKFRRTLGEFSEEEYQSAAREEQNSISRFESVLGAVNGNIHRYEAVFADEPGLFAQAEMAAEETGETGEISGITAQPHEAEPPTDDKGYVIEDTGPSYFNPPGAEDTSPTIQTGSAPARDADEVSGPAPQGLAKIVIINGDNAGAAYHIKGTLSIGRAESNSVTIKDAKASRQHAQVQRQGTEHIVVDLNSSNGTYVNGERIEEHVLADGDEIRIGDCIMQFQE